MTEPEWLACADPTPMLEYVSASGLLSDRKQRLLDCACVRRLWHLLLDERGQKAVEVAETFADGLASVDTLREAQAAALAAADDQATLHISGKPNCYTGKPDCYSVLAAAAGAAWEYRSGADPLWHAANALAWEGHQTSGNPTEQRTARRTARKNFAQERKTQACLLREIVGNPFQPVTVSPSATWLVVHSPAWSTARRIYHQCEFDRLPLLAEALERAGCSNPKMLGHCWLPGPHVRGCWVVDLVLGKE